MPRDNVCGRSCQTALKYLLSAVLRLKCDWEQGKIALITDEGDQKPLERLRILEESKIKNKQTSKQNIYDKTISAWGTEAQGDAYAQLR